MDFNPFTPERSSRGNANSAACCINLVTCQTLASDLTRNAQKLKRFDTFSTLALRLQGDAADEVVAGTGGPDELRSQPARSSREQQTPVKIQPSHAVPGCALRHGQRQALPR